MGVDLAELERRLDELTTAILVPLRSDKRLDPTRMAELHQLMDEFAAARSQLETIPTRLAGKLVLVFTQMLTEADYAPDPEAILRPAWNYGNQVERFFLARA